MIASPSDCNSGSPCTQTRCLSRCITTISRSISKLSEVISPPTTHSPIIEDCTCMISSRSDCNCSSPCTQTRCLSRRIRKSVSSISKLTMVISPPTTHSSIIENCTCMIIPCSDCNCSSPCTQTRCLSRYVPIFISVFFII